MLQPHLSGQWHGNGHVALRLGTESTGFKAIGNPGPCHKHPGGVGADGGVWPAAILSMPLQKAMNQFSRPCEKASGFYDPY